MAGHRDEPDGRVNTAATVASCYDAGLAALDRGDFEDAKLWARRCEAAPGGAADARCAALLVDLGYACLASGNRHDARAALERVAALHPGDPTVGRSLAQMYEALGEMGRAAAALAEIARQTPTPRVLTDLARLHLRLDQYAEAEAAFRALAKLDPEHELLAWHGRTWCRIKRGDWRGALDVALGATRLDRFNLTTAFLAYAKDRLFTRVADGARREAELQERFQAELEEHDEFHSGERAAATPEEDRRA